jgi:hypothetical protein
VRALAPLLVGLVAAAGLVSAVPVLTFSDERSTVVVPMHEGQHYTYSYLNSVYRAPVEERHSYAGGRLHVLSVASPDIRAVEYFRWSGEPVQAGGIYEQAAPDNEQTQLLIRVTPQYQQRLAGAGWSIDLGSTFGDSLVRVWPERRPIAWALIRGWRP